MSQVVQFQCVGSFEINIEQNLKLSVYQAEDAAERANGAMVMLGDAVIDMNVKESDISFLPGQWHAMETCIHFRNYAFPVDDDQIPAIRKMFARAQLKSV